MQGKIDNRLVITEYQVAPIAEEVANDVGDPESDVRSTPQTPSSIIMVVNQSPN
jgi:hypothetical protein